MAFLAPRLLTQASRRAEKSGHPCRSSGRAAFEKLAPRGPGKPCGPNLARADPLFREGAGTEGCRRLASTLLALSPGRQRFLLGRLSPMSSLSAHCRPKKNSGRQQALVNCPVFEHSQKTQPHPKKTLDKPCQHCYISVRNQQQTTNFTPYLLLLLLPSFHYLDRSSIGVLSEFYRRCSRPLPPQTPTLLPSTHARASQPYLSNPALHQCCASGAPAIRFFFCNSLFYLNL